MSADNLNKLELVDTICHSYFFFLVISFISYYNRQPLNTGLEGNNTFDLWENVKLHAFLYQTDYNVLHNPTVSRDMQPK